MKLQYERCYPKDLSRLIQLARKTFIDAFEAQNDPHNFATYMNTVLTEKNLEKELLHPDSNFYFVKYESRLVGYFKTNENVAQTELKGTDSMELERIYVSEAYQGLKIGSWMLQQVIAIAKNKHLNFLWLGVWEQNTAAIKFYKKFGFIKFGEHPYFVGNDKQIDWLMRLDLVTLKS